MSNCSVAVSREAEADIEPEMAVVLAVVEPEPSSPVFSPLSGDDELGEAMEERGVLEGLNNRPCRGSMTVVVRDKTDVSDWALIEGV